MKTYLLLLSILTAACTTKELKYTKEQLFVMAQAGDPNVQIILPKSMSEGVHCTDYSDGCISAHTVKIKNLDMIAVEFMNEKDAIYAAKKFRGFYTRNWLLDDVTGEPSLEEFVVKYLEAKKP
ncbi:MAG: hypothetical protein AB7I27_09375 [Bacteriovoracaceae bacterium]